MREFLDDFRQTVCAATEGLLAMPEERAARRPAPGKWSPKEVVGHLIDSASNNHRRFVVAQHEDDLVFPGYDQDAWVVTQRYREAPWSELVEVWRGLNLHLARVVEAIPEDIRLRERRQHNLHQIAWRTVPEDRPATLDGFIRDYLGHLKHHLRQIDPELATVG